MVTPQSYVGDKTTFLYDKDKLVSDVQGNNRCLFVELYETHINTYIM